MSTFAVEVVPVELDAHPNADSLSVVQVYGYQVCVRTEDWLDKTIGAYIPPDSVVPATEQFAFLGEREKDRIIRAKRLRGVWSMGMLVPAPEGAKLGDDVAEALGITHYEPPLRLERGHRGEMTMGKVEAGPAGYRPKYDIENLRRYPALFLPGELVMVTEKIHGTNARFTYHNGRVYCGSRNEWKAEDERSPWWRVLRQYQDSLGRYLETHPDVTVYGEIYGAIQTLHYGLGPGELAFAAFDIMSDRVGVGWLDAERFRQTCRVWDIPTVPLLYTGEMHDGVLDLTDGPSLIPGADHLREGIVIRPMQERMSAEIGRVHLKVVSNDYLAQKAA